MQGIEHYENFPVASWLCPPRLRPAILAIYRFARTADDLADEGVATPDQRLTDLQAYRAALHACVQHETAHRWPEVFEPLSAIIQQHALPISLLTDLLDAFEQDVRYTAGAQRYEDRTELLAYCARSANPSRMAA